MDSYSIKNFIKTNCTEKYDINQLHDIATKLTIDSLGRYTDKSALKLLCRYTYVKNNKILFDSDNRNADRTFNDIESELLKKDNKSESSKSSIKSSKSSIKSSKSSIKSSSSMGKPFDKPFDKNIKIPKSTKTDAKKSGFGNFNALKKIINSESESESEPKTNLKTKSENNPKIKSNDKQKPHKIKGGFGIFTKSSIKSTEKDMNINSKPIILKKKGNEYTYQSEPKYEGLIRSDPLYGPYGTDSYFDKHIIDDKIDKSLTDIIDIYRKLESQYYPAQRSPEWFALRDEMITASDGGTVMGLNPYEAIFGFIIKKVHGKPFETSEECYHGKKYEQVATMAYEFRMNVRVKEFGLCRHPTLDFLGASPDGIVSEYKLQTKDGRTWNELEEELELIDDWEDKRKFMAEYGFKTKYVGRMLEIKCPMRRKILMSNDAPEVYGVHGEIIEDLKKDSKKGICPSYYWIQVQLQLQCCMLFECSFWQCEISEYADKEAFLDDTDITCPWLSRQTGHEKGAVIQLLPVDQVNNKTMEYKDRIYNFASFIYQPKINMTPMEIDKWINNTLNDLNYTHKGFVFERIFYWRIDVSRNIDIQRDDKWFADNVERFRQMWEYVKILRADKYKSDLLKRYINIFPLDYYKKITEGRKKGIIMETIKKLCSEPIKSAPVKQHKDYAKFITDIESEIKKSNKPIKEYNVSDDIKYIIDSLDIKFLDKLNDNEKEKEKKKFIEFVKGLKNNVENYLYQSDD